MFLLKYLNTYRKINSLFLPRHVHSKIKVVLRTDLCQYVMDYVHYRILR